MEQKNNLKNKTKEKSPTGNHITQSGENSNLRGKGNSFGVEKVKDGIQLNVRSKLTRIFGTSDRNLIELLVNQAMDTFGGYQSSEGINEERQLTHCTHSIFGITATTACLAYGCANLKLSNKKGL